MKTIQSNEIFSLASLLYVRMRRVSGRVVDAIHFAENAHYAKHIMNLALATQDAELQRLVLKLQPFFETPSEAVVEDKPKPVVAKVVEAAVVPVLLIEEAYAPTAEEIYQAQVSHHYIGTLR